MTAGRRPGPRTAADLAADARRTGRRTDTRRGTALGQLLTDARLAKGWTLAETARQVGVTGGREISNWEHGWTTPGSRRLWRIQQVLELDAGELLVALHFAPKSHSGRKANPAPKEGDSHE